MLLTDKQARKETCPHITYCVNEVDVVQEGRGSLYVHQLCQGSDCKMAWRWNAGADFLEVGEVPLGYCGIAGKVEG